MKKCKECGGKLIIDKNEAFCERCGLVAADAPIYHKKKRVLRG